jgi:hypothetical protein
MLVPSLGLHGNPQVPQCRTLERRLLSGEFLILFFDPEGIDIVVNEYDLPDI